jgi:hypothetical protein
MAKLLPAGFEDLEAYALEWDVQSANERRARRLNLTMGELRSVYDAVLHRADQAFAYIDRFPIGSLPEDAHRLLRLVLGLAHAAISIEVHQQHRGHNAPETDTLQITGDFWPQ